MASQTPIYNTNYTPHYNTVEGRNEKHKHNNIASKINTAATVYGAFKLMQISGEMENLNANVEVLNGISGEILNCSQRTNNLLDLQNKEIEKSIKINNSTLEILKKTFDAEKKRELKEDARYAKEQHDRERDRIEKLLEKEKKSQLQNLKNLIHSISREQQLITKSNLTNLEKYLSLKKLSNIIIALSANDLEDIADKKYRDDAEDEIDNSIMRLEESFTDQDKSDKKAIEQIEKIDENVQIAKILDRLLVNLDKLNLTNNYLIELEKEYRIKNKTDHTDFDKFKREFNKFEQRIVSLNTHRDSL